MSFKNSSIDAARAEPTAGLAREPSVPPGSGDATFAVPAHEGLRLGGQEALLRIPVSVRIVLGAARMPISKLLNLARGAVIPLDRKVGDLVDIVVNDRLVARGEVVVLDDNAERFAVAVREVVRSGDG